MFCNACGKPIPATAATCPECGHAQPLTVIAAPQGSRVARNAKLLGILWIAYSVLHVLAGLAAFIVGNTVIAAVAAREPRMYFLPPLVTAIGIAILAKGAIGAAAGFGILQRAHWARTAALVVAFLSLFNVPFGLALGIYTLWALLAGDGEREWEAYVAGQPAA
ncbi:MAG TPA: zinc ribbon domain-containing protein [Terriglobales bacterium]|jgi:hypothetical protein|nr:zinc ribbon domain-containing protein [Terriglobales bacterium]